MDTPANAAPRVDALLYMATISIYPLPALVETMDHRLLRQLDRGGHDAGG